METLHTSDPVVSVRLPAEITDRISVVALALERDRSWVLRTALREYLERAERKFARRKDPA